MGLVEGSGVGAVIFGSVGSMGGISTFEPSRGGGSSSVVVGVSPSTTGAGVAVDASAAISSDNTVLKSAWRFNKNRSKVPSAGTGKGGASAAGVSVGTLGER